MTIMLEQLRAEAQRFLVAHERPKRCPPLVALARSYGGTEADADEVLVFGDSVAGRTARYDVLRATLTGLVAEGLAPAQRTCAVVHAGFHPGVFSALTKALRALPQRPRVIVVPINIRCISPQWARNPKWQFEHVVTAVEMFAEGQTAIPRMTLDVVPAQASVEEFLATPAGVVGFEGWTVGDFERRVRKAAPVPLSEVERRRLTFAYHYLSLADPASPRIKALEELATTGEALGCAVVAYLTPINHEAGRRLLGGVFDEVLAANVDVVLTALRSAGMTTGPGTSVEDWSRLLSSEAFFHELLPTEHLNESGRRRLAREIVGMTKAAS